MQKNRSSVSEDLPVDQGGRAFRTPFSGRYRVAIVFPGEGRTKQSFKDECDINRIMGRYLSSGILPEHLNQAMAQFVDCTAVDFQDAQLLVAGAKSLFAELPASVRDRFHHSPAEFLAFAENPANGVALAQMGLATLRKDSPGGGSTPPPRRLQQRRNPQLLAGVRARRSRSEVRSRLRLRPIHILDVYWPTGRIFPGVV